MEYDFESENLTSHQKQALTSRIDRQKRRYFTGTSTQAIASSFAKVNELKKSGREQEANEREIELFKICNYKP